jgi:hypothetical protein
MLLKRIHIDTSIRPVRQERGGNAPYFAAKLLPPGESLYGVLLMRAVRRLNH